MDEHQGPTEVRFADVGDGEDVELRVDTGPGLWQLHGDRTNIEKMLDIVVSNARELMPWGRLGT